MKGKVLMKKVILFFLSLSLIAFFFRIDESTANQAGFSVKAILPENQKPGSLSYFDFELLPNEEKLIEIEIENSTSEEKKYLIEINSASTNINGVIDYSRTEKDFTLPISMEDIALVDSEVVIAGGDSKKVPIKLKMPVKSFEGILLGGLRIREAGDKNNQKEQIGNSFSYTIALVIAQGDVTPPIELDMIGVSTSQVNKRNIINGNLQNISSTIVNNLTIKAQVYRAGETGKPIFKRTGESLRMAPNSNFNFGIETNNQPLKSGKYRMEVQAFVDEKKWEWSEEFEITSEQAKKLNETAVELESKNLFTHIIILSSILVLALFIIVYLILKNRDGRGK